MTVKDPCNIKTLKINRCFCDNILPILKRFVNLEHIKLKFSELNKDIAEFISSLPIKTVDIEFKNTKEISLDLPNCQSIIIRRISDEISTEKIRLNVPCSKYIFSENCNLLIDNFSDELLYFRYENTDDEMFERLMKLKNIKYIDIRDSFVTDISSLSDSVKYLNIKNTYISNMISTKNIKYINAENTLINKYIFNDTNICFIV